jgi:sigma-B regulation protein RsbU (phosphoserine phosphatase)
MSTQSRSGAASAAALARILEVTRDLARPLGLTELLAKVVDAALALLDAERGSVFLYDAAENELVTRVATGAGEIRIPADRGIAGECVRSREVIVVNDAYADARFNREVDRATGFRTRNLLTIPLLGLDDVLVGVLQVLNKREGSFGDEDVAVGSALAAGCAVALQRGRLLEEKAHKDRLERELAVARDIQIGILPKNMPKLPGYEVAGWSRPADQTGGDTFDVISVDGGCVLLLGDATGHGIGPALSVTQVRAMLRMALRLNAGVDDAFRHMNDQLEQDLSNNRFVTCFLGRVDTVSHTLAYHSGGQGPILHRQAATGIWTRIEPTGMPLGILPSLRSKPARVLELAPGDTVALISDGVFEYEDASGQMFGTDRVEELLGRCAAEPAESQVSELVGAVARFAGRAPQNDDMTVVLLRRLSSL